MMTEGSRLKFSDLEFAQLGDGAVGYIREIDNERAEVLLGGATTVPMGARLFCLYNADGTPVSISGSREAALANAAQQELTAMAVH
ncbi:MAG: DUF1150 domain-containing protein [Aestuariivirgaceae bacterium]|nr:DUF1150 domain-containing protein [Aestuariivirgaceae bacterium]